MEKWNHTKPFPLTQKHRQLAETLTSMHVEESPHTRLPSYHYNQLKKGILCPLKRGVKPRIQAFGTTVCLLLLTDSHNDAYRRPLFSW